MFPLTTAPKYVQPHPHTYFPRACRGAIASMPDVQIGTCLRTHVDYKHMKLLTHVICCNSRTTYLLQSQTEIMGYFDAMQLAAGLGEMWVGDNASVGWVLLLGKTGWTGTSLQENYRWLSENLGTVPRFHEGGPEYVNMSLPIAALETSAFNVTSYVQQSPRSRFWVCTFWGIVGGRFRCFQHPSTKSSHPTVSIHNEHGRVLHKFVHIGRQFPLLCLRKTTCSKTLCSPHYFQSHGVIDRIWLKISMYIDIISGIILKCYVFLASNITGIIVLHIQLTDEGMKEHWLFVTHQNYRTASRFTELMDNHQASIVSGTYLTTQRCYNASHGLCQSKEQKGVHSGCFWRKPTHTKLCSQQTLAR